MYIRSLDCLSLLFSRAHSFSPAFALTYSPLLHLTQPIVITRWMTFGKNLRSSRSMLLSTRIVCPRLSSSMETFPGAHCRCLRVCIKRILHSYIARDRTHFRCSYLIILSRLSHPSSLPRSFFHLLAFVLTQSQSQCAERSWEPVRYGVLLCCARCTAPGLVCRVQGQSTLKTCGWTEIEKD